MFDTKRTDHEKRGAFRKLLERSGTIVMPAAYDALSARIIERVGFEAAFHSGHGTSVSLLGVSDIGLVCFAEMQSRVYRIAKSIDIPLFADADTGYGNALNLSRTTKEFIWAGASGLFFEDQVWPKRCGYMRGKEVIPKAEFVGRARAAVAARNEQDRLFTLMARTDAASVNGLADAIERVNLCAEVGVDLGFVHGLETTAQMKQATKECIVPLMFSMAGIEMGAVPYSLSVQEAEDLGFKIVEFGAATWLASAKAMKDVLISLKETGSVLSYRASLMDGWGEFGSLVGLESIRNMEREYLTPSAEG